MEIIDTEYDSSSNLISVTVNDCGDVMVFERRKNSQRWEDTYHEKYANKLYRCSGCKQKALYRHERDLLGSYHSVQALTRICPHCGAHMIGVKEDYSEA